MSRILTAYLNPRLTPAPPASPASRPPEQHQHYHHHHHLLDTTKLPLLRCPPTAARPAQRPHHPPVPHAATTRPCTCTTARVSVSPFEKHLQKPANTAPGPSVPSTQASKDPVVRALVFCTTAHSPRCCRLRSTDPIPLVSSAATRFSPNLVPLSSSWRNPHSPKPVPVRVWKSRAKRRPSVSTSISGGA